MMSVQFRKFEKNHPMKLDERIMSYHHTKVDGSNSSIFDHSNSDWLEIISFIHSFMYNKNNKNFISKKICKFINYNLVRWFELDHKMNQDLNICHLSISIMIIVIAIVNPLPIWFFFVCLENEKKVRLLWHLCNKQTKKITWKWLFNNNCCCLKKKQNKTLESMMVH